MQFTLKILRYGYIRNVVELKRDLLSLASNAADGLVQLARQMLDWQIMTVFLGNQKLDVLESFVYFGDGISPSAGCEVSTIARVRSIQGKFHELLLMLGNKSV